MVNKLGKVPIVVIRKSPEILARTIYCEDFGAFVAYAIFLSAKNKCALVVQPQGGYVHLVVGAIK